ncbi:Argonaute 3 [Carabus blaptoides fortunei]
MLRALLETSSCSLQKKKLERPIWTNRTTTAVARLSLKEQNRNQVAVVPDEDISGFYINFEANCFTGNVPLALYQYRVDFDPDVDRSQVRKKILAQVYRNTLSGYMCDGFVLFTPTPIPPNFLTKLTNLEGYSCEFKLVLHRVETEQPDYHLSHLVHKCMKLLKLQMVGRHSRDALAVRYHINVIFHYQPLLVSRAEAQELRIDNERSKTLMLTPDERSCRLKLFHERMAKYTTERGSVFSRISILNGQLIIKTVHPWVVMCPVHIGQVVTKYVHDLQKFSGTMGMNLPRPTVQVIDDDKPATYIDGLEYAINTFKPELVLCIINKNKSDRYNAIKKICYVDRGVRSQIMLRANLNNKGIMEVATQIYCKLGGDPWIMNIPVTTLMVIGIHVTRDSIDKKISYSAMVSSLDKKVTKYYTKVSIHANAEELCSNLCANIIDALRKYQQENKDRLPDNIIIYRHGIRDFRWSEVRGIRTVLDILNHKKGKAIKFAFILVTKRATTLTQVEHLFNR